MPSSTPNQDVLDAFARTQDARQLIDLCVLGLAVVGGPSLARELNQQVDRWFGVVERGEVEDYDPKERVLLADLPVGREDLRTVDDGENPPMTTQTQESKARNEDAQARIEEEADADELEQAAAQRELADDKAARGELS